MYGAPGMALNGAPAISFPLTDVEQTDFGPQLVAYLAGIEPGHT
jgi:hypothetical protein